ncbi:nucleotidyl transferase family protein [Anaeromicrobium sediminis]|uniref:nicotinate-nucleotide adenylyltransferase n=1 Tax=Anaeromicrobium sediminis TaxID=1478221 RepID=A0A267MIA3_9FIRM|nr:cytidyltransferase [Anaeromicrobium sediminis]PAB58530.1 hypothetical protein CCE28_14590 [Anaeromicrobium sediminis]
MDRNLFDNLYNFISYRLLSKSFLKDNYDKKNIFKEYIQTKEFKDKLKTLSDNNAFSCTAVLSLLEDLLNSLSPKPPDDWLKYIYEYTLHKSFPHGVKIELHEELDFPCYIYLQTLRIVCQLQKISNDNTWQSKYPLNFLSRREIASLEDPTEYKTFVKSFNNNYVYELMKLNSEVLGHSLIDHVCGVHYLAMYISRQIKESGMNIDLGRVSGSTIGHDIGKLGCIDEEKKKAAYLHYYYTDLWFNNNNLEYIRNIAANHSVWDLELENLSIESLILIYCDFRVKSINRKMHIVSINDAFSVILNKLDNVDTKKKLRYKRVYNKLKDFEDFLIDKHVSVNLEDPPLAMKNEKKLYSLMNGNDVIDNLKYLSINYNIDLMHTLRTESSLDLILKSARSETLGTNLRKYLRVFEEYSTYLTQNQKKIALTFLYELLTHHEDDIRKQSANIIGKLIGIFDNDYRKDIPSKFPPMRGDLTSKEILEKYVHMFLHPDYKIIPNHKRWIRELFGVMIKSFFENSKSTEALNIHIVDYISVLIKEYKNPTEDILLYLIDGIISIPLSEHSPYYGNIMDFVLNMSIHNIYNVRVNALNSLLNLIDSIPITPFYKKKIMDIITKLNSNDDSLIEYYLSQKIESKITPNCEKCHVVLTNNQISTLTLSNLKSATDPVVKRVQIDILLNHVLKDNDNGKLRTAMHFCNILKVSSYNRVRIQAGESLLKIISYLSPENRNEIAIELFSALELAEYQFSKSVADYLGKIILTLRPNELDEFIKTISTKIRISNENITSLHLNAISIGIANYTKYVTEFKESNKIHDTRLKNMLSILLISLSNYNTNVKQVALEVIGKNIFGSKDMTLEEKNNIFKLINKKLLTLIDTDEGNILLSLSNTASLNHIYKFMCEYIFVNDEFHVDIPTKVAFFPGTFDPFSVSHKEIATNVRDLGFEVYLGIDEFSWSKRTLPHKLRKNIVSMSIAGELGIYIYPEDYPVNIGNSHNLMSLKNNFRNSDVSIVVGSDVILNASAYKNKTKGFSINNFNHIVFDRNQILAIKKQELEFKKASQNIDGTIHIIGLSTPFEEVSSTQIRTNIDKNRDISTLIDPLAQNYIYKNGFYRSEPQYKSPAGELTYDIQVIKDFSKELIDELCSLFEDDYKRCRINLIKALRKPSARVVTLRLINDNYSLLGFSVHHLCRIHALYNDLNNPRVSEYIREKASGKIALIDGIIIDKFKAFEKVEQILFTETLAYCLSKDYEYGIYKNLIDKQLPKTIHNSLVLQGFKKLNLGDNENPVYVVNMASPITFYADIRTVIKNPFKHNPNIKTKIDRSRKNLRKALTNLYEGNLVITFDRKVLHDILIKKICKQNNVDPIQFNKVNLGGAMCVSFGNMLNQSIIPNTVTKAMHTEKMFYPNMKEYFIGPFPYYNDLDIQVKMIKSFSRPVILIDDILHKGYRNNVIHPLLQKHNVKVQKTIVGLLSARGRELMYRQNRRVDSAYYIPKLRAWFNESLILPFFGGDTIWRGKIPPRNLTPSVNLILPYTWPAFIKGASQQSIYNLSKTCIESSIGILGEIESTYHKLYKRRLSLSSLGEVFISPRCIDYGNDMNYDLNLNPSHYLYNDLDKLDRYYKMFF